MMLKNIRGLMSVLLATCSFVMTTAYSSIAQAEPFIGEIRWVGFNFAPRGWALCDGTLLPISQNQALFSLLGTTYGGDGRTTFALPDMRGRVPVHAGSGPGLSNYTQGSQFGSEQRTLTVAQMPQHNHALTLATDDADLSDASNAMLANPVAPVAGKPNVASYKQNPMTTTQLAANTVTNSGGGQAVDVRQPSLALYCTIATTGIFPSRN